MNEDLLELKRLVLPENVKREDITDFNSPVFNTPAELQEIFNKVQEEVKEQAKVQNRRILKDLLESLPYIYIHGDKYVAIEDVLTLV